MTKFDNREKPSHIVAIGVSAGGLEALENFFDSCDSAIGCAYVVIQHLSPDFDSMMDQLLTKYTEMPVLKITDGLDIKANEIYLVGPGMMVSTNGEKFVVEKLRKENNINLPINAIFSDLAYSSHFPTIGVVLSGTGSDGSRGLLALKEANSMIIAQEPSEAQFSGMPQSAIATGAVDFILKTSEMHEYIKTYVSHPLTSLATDNFRQHLTQNSEVLKNILNLVQEEAHLNFKAYKESTVSRRIKHRISINNLSTLSEYWEFIQTSSKEVNLLKQDLLIGVTRFFRDKETWDNILKEVITPIIKNSSDTIRIWCAGCSTGEEAFTIAMLFDREAKRLNSNTLIKVFASDIDQSAINFASNSIYPASIKDEIPGEYLSMYFTENSDGMYQVCKELRQTVVFAVHNMIEDPPFSNMDLVSCRNALIYFQQSAQQKAMAFFHFSLKKDGFLLLGSSESPGKFSSYFPTVNAQSRIYQKKDDTRLSLGSMSNNNVRRGGYELKSIPQFVERVNRKMGRNRSKSVGLPQLQEQYLPPTFILNTRLQVVYSYGDTSLFTDKLRAGEVTNDVSEIVRADLVSNVLSAAHEVVRETNTVTLKNAFSHDDKSFTIRCFSFIDEDVNQRYIALSFLDASDASISETDAETIYSPDEQTQQRILELETSYIECQRMYREAIEDLDSTSEELQTSNEELMAANEELQSTNEELQSVNEELYTVNSEYQQKIVEMTETNNDLENLLNATDLAVLFLDGDLNIRRYTTPIRTYINIMDFDLERSFFDLSLKFKMDDIHDIVKKVNDEGKSYYSVIEFENTKGVEVSISPYTIGKDNQGVVVSMREKGG